jgi:DNA-binding MarR family transcriptional regulator
MNPAGPDAKQGEDLGVLLVSTSTRLNRLYGRVLAQLDPSLTFRQHRMLRRVGEGHTSMAALAAFGNLTLPTVSESVDGLVRRGLLGRRGNPQDRRQIVLSLTRSGHEAKDAGDAALAAVNDRLVQAVSEEHRQVLYESLAALYDAATEVFQRPGPAVISAAGTARAAEN